MRRSSAALGFVTALLLAAGPVACGGNNLAPVPPEPPPGPGTPALAVTPATLDFGDVKVGCGKTLAVRLENSGGATLTLGGLARPSTPFLVVDDLPATLEPGAFALLNVTYTPPAVAADSGGFSFTTNAPDVQTAIVPLTGSGVVLAPQPVDLVFVVDVSTTMDDEMDALDKAMGTVWDRISAVDLDVQVGLTTFVNDVVLHQNAAWLDRDAFFTELQSQLTFSNDRWYTNPDLPRNLANTDMPENALDALYRTADEFAWRTNVGREVVLMTDDTFVEAPTVLSGGVTVLHTYDQTALELLLQAVALRAFYSPQLPQGYAAPYNGNTSLVEMTEGTAFNIENLVAGQLHLADILLNIVENQCDEN